MLSGQGLTFGLDLAGGTSYTDLDVISVDESFGEIIDTFHKLSDGGFAHNEVVALDPEFGLVFKFDDNDAFMESLVELKWKKGTDRHAAFELVDNATGNTITGDCTITAISTSRTATAIVEVSVTIKLRGAPTIAPTV